MSADAAALARLRGLIDGVGDANVAVLAGGVSLERVPFEYRIAMGVRRDDAELARLLDAAIARRRADIDAILARYGVPRTDLRPAEAPR